MAVHFSNIIPPAWNWIAPPELIEIFQLEQPKNFAALMFALTGQESHAYFNKPVTSQSMVGIFAGEVKRQWDSGSSIMLGSEEVDWVVNDQLDGPAILSKVLSILPPGYKAFTTVVINYRAPRINHLLSLWKEVGVVKQQTFYQFVFDPATILQLHAFDPLPLVKVFLERGLKVKLIDLSGVAKQELKSYQILACDIMEVPCDANKNPVFVEERIKTRPDIMKLLTKDFNVRVNGELNVTDGQLGQIAEQLQLYDCNFKNLASHQHLTVLYDHDFGANMKKCPHNNTPMSQRELWKHIMMITDSFRVRDVDAESLFLPGGLFDISGDDLT